MDSPNFDFLSTADKLRQKMWKISGSEDTTTDLCKGFLESARRIMINTRGVEHQWQAYSSDARDIEALRYLATYRTLKDLTLPDKQLQSDIRVLVEEIHAYISTNYEDALIQGQTLARIIANPRARGNRTR